APALAGVGLSAGAVGSEVAVAAPATVRLYRAVSEAEFAELSSTGRFAAAENSLGGKFFAESAADAASWGRVLFGSSPFRLVSADLPQSVAGNLMRWERLDGIGPARYAELDELLQAIVNEVLLP
ncbi:MAG: hypothetical protein ABIU84_13910, partial [Thermoanaerobaculia bacterium]